jgi:hypothetical protein
MEVGSRIIGLPFSVLQLLLQVDRFLLRLARLGLFGTLDLMRGLDLGLQLRLMGHGGLCMQTCSSLRSFGKRLHQKKAKRS